MNKQFSEDKEKLLQTLTRFDTDITVEDVTDSGGTKSNAKCHTFFVEILLENICSTIELNENVRERLFFEVCKRLSQKEFLNDSFKFDNFLPLRRKFAKRFFNFVKQIHGEIVPDAAKSNVTAESFLKDVDFDSKLDLHGRYKNNFEELESIAQGGFGVVCKARHTVTDHTYAVKKVIFKYKSDSVYSKVIREAKNIGALRHPNIVTYNNAWVEFLPPSEYESSESSSGSEETDSDKSIDEIQQFSKDFGSLVGKENESQSFEICFTDRSVEEITWQKSTTDISTRFERESYQLNENTSMPAFQESNYEDNSTLSVSDTSYQSKNEKFNYHKKNAWDPSNLKLMLYIQMEYCDCDLRLWLDRRAEGKELPFEMDVLRIFKDILQGVAHIHSKGIIHRDLKPQNIFYSNESHVLKIGDFGLATLMNYTADDGSVSSKHSTNLGTIPYAAPEQIKYKSYDSKVDIYSLGIILIELLNKFSTKMEFASAIKDVYENNFPKDMVKNWPMLINLVQNLIKKEPEDRMPAKEILNHLNSLEMVESNREIKEKNEVLKATVKERDEVIKVLKALVKERDDEIERLKAVISRKIAK